MKKMTFLKVFMYVAAAALLAVLGLAGCGQVPVTPVSKNTAGANSVVTAVYNNAAPTSACPNGGIQVDSGIDDDGNSVLDPSEVDSTQYVCNGADGTNGTNGANGLTSLVSVSTEIAGANCIYGGKKVSVGLDTNKDAVLGSDEVTSNNYICNGTSGTNGTNGTDGTNGTNGTNSLVKITNEPAGTNCASGGVKITSGIDANNNGALDPGEEGTPSYVCGGSVGGATNAAISAPMGVVAAGADGKVVLTWNANPADMITSSNIYWSTSSNTTKTNSTKISGAASPYTLTGLTNGTTYYFFVTGVNASGEGPASWPVSAIPGTPPLAPTNVTATPGNGDNTITWTASTNAISYTVYRSLSPGVTATSGNLTWGYFSDSTTFIDYGNINNGTKYYYIVAAVNDYGESVPSAEASATPQGPPSAPQGFTATAGDSQVVLSWTASPGATSYNVYDNSVWWMPSSLIASPTGTTYTVTGLTNGNSYNYYVTAVNAIGESWRSNDQYVTPNVAPAAPTGVSAAAGDGQVTVSWTPVSGVNNYYIYWSTSPGVTKTSTNMIYVSTWGGTSYTHTGLTNGTTYYYVVTAMNTIESSESAEVSAKPLAGNTAPTTLDAANITDTTASIAGSISNPSGYTTTAWFEYGATTSYGNTTQQSAYAYSGNISVNAGLSGLTQTTTYHFRIVTQNSAGTFYGNDRTFTTLNTPGVVYTGYSSSLAVDETNIYWITSGNLYYVPISGGTSTQLASVGAWWESSIVVDATNVYTADTYNSTVNKIDKTSGAVTTLASGLSSPKSLAVDSNYVYWVESNVVRKVNISGTPIVTDIATGLSYARALAIDSANVYWIDNDGIKTVSKTGGLITVLTPSYGGRIFVDASNIYWSDYYGIYKMGLTGGTQTTLVNPSGGMYGLTFAVDSTDIYFGSGSSVSKISIAGGPVTTMSYAPGGTSVLLVDATSVYWSNGTGIYKAPK